MKTHLFDTVCLSNFTCVNAFTIILDHYKHFAAITAEVLGEVETGLVNGHVHLSAVIQAVDKQQLKVISLSMAQRRIYRTFRSHLGAGEASCIACAAKHKWIVASDDRAARNTCAEHAIPVTGTIGILKACCKAGHITLEQADAYLHTMINNGFYSPVVRLLDIG